MDQQKAQPLDGSTRVCAVFGSPIRHSASPEMQNAGLRALGLNWRYVACEVHPNHLAEAIQGARRMHFLGLNLTVPHKLLAVPLMDILDESARAWGAVNTVRFEGRLDNGPWLPLREFPDAPAETRAHGFNTDAEAIAQSLREDLNLRLEGAKVLLLGAGGAGRTAALKLASESVGGLYLQNRTVAKAAEVAEEVRQRFPEVQVSLGYPETNVDLVLNATSLGLQATDPSPLDTSRFPVHRAGAVYDMIYRPAETALLKAAREAGRPAANGLGMLLYQGAKALEIWSGQRAPLEVMREALRRAVYV